MLSSEADRERFEEMLGEFPAGQPGLFTKDHGNSNWVVIT